MSNTTLTTDIIAKAALALLDNNLVMGKTVFRGYEEEYSKNVNGYKTGETISVRRPTDFTVRQGAVMQNQDVVEGKVPLSVDRQRGVDFRFTSTEMTLKIEELSERVMKPAMIQLANQIDTDIAGLYADVPNWVGTPGETVNSFADFFKGPERLNEFAVPMDMRYAAVSPADEAGMLGTQTNLFITNPAESAYRRGRLGNLGGVDIAMTQNAPTHTVGAHAGTPLVDGATQNVTYDSVKDAYQQTLVTDGWTGSRVLQKGDVFTIDGVFAVNPVTKAKLPFLRQFVVKETVTTAASGANDTEITISPPIISSGAFQTVDAAPANDAPINYLGTASTGYRQNLVYHRNAFACVVVPMERPPGAVDVSRQSYKGLSVRVIPVYDGTNDISAYRLDVLYGVKAIDPVRLATRLSGTA